MKIILKPIAVRDDGSEFDEDATIGLEGWSAVEAHVHELEGAVNTFWVKDKVYQGAWRTQGWMGNLARILSKAARLKAMLWRDEYIGAAAGESVQDTIQDLINLAVFARRNLGQGNRWGSEVSE